MKRVTLTIAAIVMAASTIAQDPVAGDTLWKYSGITSLSLSQLALYNWAAGGDNNVAGNALIKLSADYDDGNKNWDNDLTLGFGLIKQGDDLARKSDDQIDFSSKLGFKASEHWFYTGLFSFKTQFAEGYDEPGEETRMKISNFMATAYMNFSLGMDYKHDAGFSMFISPISTKTTFVLVDDLSAAGTYGLDPDQRVRAEFGGYIKLVYKQEILKNVTLDTKIDFFSNYLDNPQHVDINWDMLLIFKVNEFLSASLQTQLIYDYDIKFENESSGEPEARVQFKELFGLGLTYSF
jgi:Protein of unknown function (DUF3078)